MAQADVCRFETFDDLGLHENVLRGIYAYGFERPSAIQQLAIKPMSLGRDVIGQAQSGTGKTATFSVGLLQRVDTSLQKCQALVLSPTRELAHQSMRVIEALSEFMHVKVHACIGGTAVNEDVRIVRSGVQVVVGTPGRVQQMIEKDALRLEALKVFVLDEADEMLSIGLKDQIYKMFRHLPEDVQVCLFSATLPQDVLDITTRFMRNPARILVKKDELTLLGIKQFLVFVEQIVLEIRHAVRLARDSAHHTGNYLLQHKR